jgi:hypothetical protein
VDQDLNNILAANMMRLCLGQQKPNQNHEARESQEELERDSQRAANRTRYQLKESGGTSPSPLPQLVAGFGPIWNSSKPPAVMV